MKLLVRGGSISAGKGVSQSYVDLLGDKLRGRGIEMINRSRECDSSFEGIWNFYDDIDPFSPEMILLHFGIDDIYRPVYRSEFKENLVQIVRLCRARFNPLIFLTTSHPFNDEYEMQSATIYYRTIREVAIDLQCNFIPVHYLIIQQMIEKNLNLRDILQRDERYPNELGHALYFTIILEKILTRLDDLFPDYHE